MSPHTSFAPMLVSAKLLNHQTKEGSKVRAATDRPTDTVGRQSVAAKKKQFPCAHEKELESNKGAFTIFGLAIQEAFFFQQIEIIMCRSG